MLLGKIEINCAFVNDSSYFPQGIVLDDSYGVGIQRLFSNLQTQDTYTVTTPSLDETNVNLSLGDADITLNLVKQTEDYVGLRHVCLWEATSYRYDNLLRMKRFVAAFKQKHPITPIILYGFEGSLKSCPNYCKESGLEDYNLLTQRGGEQFAREIGAVKYVEYDARTGRGAKILADEIAYAGLGKIMDEMEMQERRKCCCCDCCPCCCC